MRRATKSPYYRHARKLAGGLTLLAAAAPAQAQVTGINYSLTPAITRVEWSDNVPLERIDLYGGKLGLNFGRHVALQGFYLFNNNGRTDLLGRSFNAGNGLNYVATTDQDVKVARYGGNLVFTLNSGIVTPFVQLTGGVLSFDPEQGDKLEQIHLGVGGGIKFEPIERLQVQLFAEDLAFRLNRFGLLTDADRLRMLPGENDFNADKIRYNLSYGAGLTFYLGGSRADQMTDLDRALMERFNGGLGGVSFPLQLSVGKLDFDKKLGLGDDQKTFVGANIGLDFGPFFGVRGFYNRVVNNDFSKLQGIQLYGAETKFKLNAGSGFVPYLIVGAGNLDFQKAYRVDAAATEAPADRLFGIGGVGVGLNIGDRLKLDGSVRDLLISSTDADNIGSTRDVVSSTYQYAVGINLAIGGNTGNNAPSVITRAEAARLEAEAADRAARQARQETREQMLAEAAARAQTRAERDSINALIADARREGLAANAVQTSGTTNAMMPQAVRNAQGERIVTLPLPEQGEIYIRYGEPGGVNINSQDISHSGNQNLTTEQLRALVRDAVAAEMGRTAPAPAQQMTSPGQTAAEQELRMREMEDRLMNRLQTQTGQQPAPVAPAPSGPVIIQTNPGTAAQPQTVVIPTQPGQVTAPQIVTPPATDGQTTVTSETVQQVNPTTGETMSRTTQQATTSRGFLGTGLHTRTYAPFIGYGLDTPKQTVFGVRFGFSPLTNRIQFTPDLNVGSGDGATSINLNLHFTAPIGSFGRLQPYVGAGPGLFIYLNKPDNADVSSLTFNLLGGVKYAVGARLDAFAEYDAYDLFNLNRISAGLQWTR